MFLVVKWSSNSKLLEYLSSVKALYLSDIKITVTPVLEHPSLYCGGLIQMELPIFEHIGESPVPGRRAGKSLSRLYQCEV